MTDEQRSGWTGGQRAFGDFAPGMVYYTDKVLFGEVWEREGLSKRDRSLITVAALTAMGRPTSSSSTATTPARTASPRPS